MAEDERDVPELAEQIVRADEEQQHKRRSNRRRWWSDGAARVRRVRTDPTAPGAPAKAPLPWRTYISIGAAVMVVVLLIISLLNE